MKLLLASRNPYKKKEMQEILSSTHSIIDLNDLGIADEIIENGITFEENALFKARYLNTKLKLDCIAEDSGLEIESLGGAPGVYSARYSGEPKDDQKNIDLVLKNLKSHSNRRARFKTVIAFVTQKNYYLFDGSIEGTIGLTPRGSSGFGYDPIFIPDGYELSFAELGDVIKNRISHRSQALSKLIAFLTN